jgi:hypothetical protein
MPSKRTLMLLSCTFFLILFQIIDIFVLQSLRRKQKEWGDSVSVIHSDMRFWQTSLKVWFSLIFNLGVTPY